ncbi:MAG TPA: hypothetical protein VFQ56_07585, partial [Flavobacterium sp.]|nr:hypothetical protein [Flavobacterium sp.]
MKNLNIIGALFISLFLVACKKSSQPNNNENSKPILPDFSWTGSQIAPAEITFTNKTQNGATYRWDFNNGTSSTLET